MTFSIEETIIIDQCIYSDSSTWWNCFWLWSTNRENRAGEWSQTAQIQGVPNQRNIAIQYNMTTQGQGLKPVAVVIPMA